MLRRTACIATLALALGTGLAWAHEGHVHKVMGTVASNQGNHLMVKTADGKTVDVTTNDKTAITRGADKITMADLTAGQRVVIDVGDGKEPLVARAVKVGGAKAASGKAGAAHEHHDEH